MWASDRRRRLSALGATAWLVLCSSDVRGQTATLQVHQAAFNALASAVQPVTMTGQYHLTAPVWTPFGTVHVTVCNSAWSATVSQLAFTIDSSAVRVSGRVDARWCGVSFNAAITTTASVAYQTAQEAITVTVNPTAIQPRFNVLGHNVTLPVSINIAPALSLPALPVTTALLQIETANGPVALRMSPRNISLTRRNGYLELQGSVNVW